MSLEARQGPFGPSRRGMTSDGVEGEMSRQSVFLNETVNMCHSERGREASDEESGWVA